jgi:hypothetical protein
MGGSVESFYPEGSGHAYIEEKTMDTVVQRPNNALGLSVLRGCVWTGEAKRGAMGSKMCAHGQVVEFTAVVSLKGKCIGN